MTTQNFIDFNGKPIYFSFENGTYWIAIKPICEALGVNYKGQHTQLIKDEIYGQLSYSAKIVAADNRLRKMVCLPEEFIYGWLMSIKSNSPSLTKYKLQCHKILYQHFKGSITQRKVIIEDKSLLRKEIDDLHRECLKITAYRTMLQKKEQLKLKNKAVKELDSKLENNENSFPFGKQ